MSAIELGQSDAPLLAAMGGGDVSALGTLYDRYGGVTYALAYRILGDAPAAEDVVHEVFVDAWRRLRGVDARRVRVRAWLLATAHRRCIDRLRGAKGQQADPPPVARDLGDEDGDSATIERLEAAEIRQALTTVPAEQYRALTLAYFSGLSGADLATALGVPPGTAASWLRLGLETLRTRLLSSPLPPTSAPRE